MYKCNKLYSQIIEYCCSNNTFPYKNQLLYLHFSVLYIQTHDVFDIIVYSLELKIRICCPSLFTRSCSVGFNLFFAFSRSLHPKPSGFK